MQMVKFSGDYVEKKLFILHIHSSAISLLWMHNFRAKKMLNNYTKNESEIPNSLVQLYRSLTSGILVDVQDWRLYI